MTLDSHLQTGEYEAGRYWSARAAASGGDIYRAVCDFSLSTAENAAMERIQLALLDDLLAGVGLADRSVLELGCGVGRLAPFFLARGACYTGCDISNEMLKLARARIPGAGFGPMRSDELPAEDSSQDLTVSVTVLQHNDLVTQGKLLAEIARVTRPGGYALLLEGLTSADGRASFNMFPRSFDGWLGALPEGLDPVRWRVARWWPTRDLARFVWRGLRRSRLQRGGAKARRSDPGPTERILLRLGAVIDPFLLRLLPRRHATTVAILSRRRGSA